MKMMDMAPPPEHPPATIGYREYAHLPDWGVQYVKAKADTGARSSAIDVAEIEDLPDNRVRFKVMLSRKNRERSVVVEAPIVRRAVVRTSMGHRDERYTVETTLRIGPVERVVEIGLVCRKNMICRMLLGRQALAGEFLVDPDRTYLYGKRRAKRPVGPRRKKKVV